MNEAYFDIARRLPAALGSDLYQADVASNYQSFLEYKDVSIVIVSRNGVKTLRDYTDTPKDSDAQSRLTNEIQWKTLKSNP